MKRSLFILILLVTQFAWSSEKGCEIAKELVKFRPILNKDDEGYLRFFKNDSCQFKWTVDDFISLGDAQLALPNGWEWTKEHLTSNINSHHSSEPYKVLARKLLLEIEEEDAIIQSSINDILVELGQDYGDYQFTEKVSTLRMKDNAKEEIILDCLVKKDDQCLKANLVIQSATVTKVIYRFKLTPEFLKSLKKEMRIEQRKDFYVNSDSFDMWEMGAQLTYYTYGILAPIGIPLMALAIPTRIVESVVYLFLKKHKRIFSDLLDGVDVTVSERKFHDFTIMRAIH